MSAPGGCLLQWGVSAVGGMSVPGGVCTGGVSALWGVCSQGVLSAPGGSALGGVCSQRVSAPGVCLLREGTWWRPPDGYSCGQYASYWNAFLFITMFANL